MAFRRRRANGSDDAELTALWTAQQPAIANAFDPVAVPLGWDWTRQDIEVFVSTDALGIRGATIAIDHVVNYVIHGDPIHGDQEVVMFWRGSLNAVNFKAAVKELWGAAAGSEVLKSKPPDWTYWALFPQANATIRNIVNNLIQPNYVILRPGDLPGYDGQIYFLIWLDMVTIAARAEAN